MAIGGIDGKKKQPPGRRPKRPVRELGRELDPAVRAGVVAARRWREHDQVTPESFDRAVEAWLHGAPGAAG